MLTVFVASIVEYVWSTNISVFTDHLTGMDTPFAATFTQVQSSQQPHFSKNVHAPIVACSAKLRLRASGSAQLCAFASKLHNLETNKMLSGSQIKESLSSSREQAASRRHMLQHLDR